MKQYKTTLSQRLSAKKYRQMHPVLCKERDKKWQESHKVERKKYMHNYHLKDKDKLNLMAKNWKLANPERIRDTARNWRIENPEHIKKYKREWQLANPRSSSHYSIEMLESTDNARKRDNNTCQWQGCGLTHKETIIHVHHIFPKSEYPKLELVEQYMICYCIFHHELWHKYRKDSYANMISKKAYNEPKEPNNLLQTFNRYA